MAEKETARVAVDQQNLERRLIQQRQAYTHLFRGAEQLLRLGAIFWTERWLLRLIRYLYRRRLEQLSATATQLMLTGHLKENMLEAAVEAALQGHELGEWEQVDETGQEWEASDGHIGRGVKTADDINASCQHNGGWSVQTISGKHCHHRPAYAIILFHFQHRSPPFASAPQDINGRIGTDDSMGGASLEQGRFLTPDAIGIGSG